MDEKKRRNEEEHRNETLSHSQMVDIVIVLCAFFHQDIKDVLNMKIFPPSVGGQINARWLQKA